MAQRNTYEYQKARGLKRKMELIRLKGGSCEVCGYNANVAALEFHHKDPNEKEMRLDLRRLANHRWEKLVEEANKCMLLCANHHREIHNPDKDLQTITELVKHYDETIISNREKTINTCDDCGVEVHHSSKRCLPCNGIKRRKALRPDNSLLLEEAKQNGYAWCGRKYGVSRTTIKRWLGILKARE